VRISSILHMNNILFGAIGVLMLAITTLGAAELRVQAHSAERLTQGSVATQSEITSSEGAVDVTAQAPSATITGNIVQAAEKARSAFSDDWSDDDDEYDFDDDEDDRPSQSVTQGSAQATAPSAPATKPSTAPAPATVDAYTLAQLATHNSSASCYSAINGSVYDLTSFVSHHPGGAAAIKSLCGVDGTAAYNGQHGGSRRPANELASLKIGVLAK
jgi:cytochrome b involved in lipid metabolism